MVLRGGGGKSGRRLVSEVFKSEKVGRDDRGEPREGGGKGRSERAHRLTCLLGLACSSPTFRQVPVRPEEKRILWSAACSWAELFPSPLCTYLQAHLLNLLSLLSRTTPGPCCPPKATSALVSCRGRPVTLMMLVMGWRKLKEGGRRRCRVRRPLRGGEDGGGRGRVCRGRWWWWGVAVVDQTGHGSRC